MRTVASALSTEFARDGHAILVPLVEIRSATPIYRTPWNRAIAFDGDTYTPDSLEWGEIGAALRPSSPTVTLSLQNLRDPVTDDERPWSLLLADEDLVGVEVDVRIVMTSQLSDTTAQVQETLWRIKSARLRGTRCDLDLGAPFEPAAMTVPYPMLRAPWCLYEYKDRHCRSESTETTCAKGLAACIARHAMTAIRFSQYPHDTDMRRIGG